MVNRGSKEKIARWLGIGLSMTALVGGGVAAWTDVKADVAVLKDNKGSMCQDIREIRIAVGKNQIMLQNLCYETYGPEICNKQ